MQCMRSSYALCRPTSHDWNKNKSAVHWDDDAFYVQKRKTWVALHCRILFTCRFFLFDHVSRLCSLNAIYKENFKVFLCNGALLYIHSAMWILLPVCPTPSKKTRLVWRVLIPATSTFSFIFVFDWHFSAEAGALLIGWIVFVGGATVDVRTSTPPFYY